ncbi:hypothetical protein L2E82_25890 [Cichorium intybus]|uniref:Uncharacterized protein n=1 Tax=Cichorium intybus TaxID=13427 RepID=A0ACB9E4W4_CICIN|nr:hypothetical protein L2E82_25890 [Cichorium intybus]
MSSPSSAASAFNYPSVASCCHHLLPWFRLPSIQEVSDPSAEISHLLGHTFCSLKQAKPCSILNYEAPWMATAPSPSTDCRNVHIRFLGCSLLYLPWDFSWYPDHYNCHHLNLLFYGNKQSMTNDLQITAPIVVVCEC